MSRFKGLALLLAAAAMPATAVAQTITFDDVNTSGCAEVPLPNGYNGFNWNNFLVMDATTLAACNGMPPSTVLGYRNGIVSSPNVAFTGYANPVEVYRTNPFTFNSVYLTAAWNDNLNVLAQGYNGATLLYTTNLTVQPTGPTNEIFNWANVTDVWFTPSGGTIDPLLYGRGGGTHLVFDNMVLNGGTVVPEPATLLLLGTGLAGLGLAGLLRRAA